VVRSLFVIANEVEKFIFLPQRRHVASSLLRPANEWF